MRVGAQRRGAGNASLRLASGWLSPSHVQVTPLCLVGARLRLALWGARGGRRGW